jgi:hypothetical protein
MKIICALVLFLTTTIAYADEQDQPKTPIGTISPTDLRYKEFNISTLGGDQSSTEIRFEKENEVVVLHDISFVPVPSINRRITGICRIKFLVNDVPLALGGWSLAGSSLNKPNNKGGGNSRPCGNFAEIEPGFCAPVTTLVVDVIQLSKPLEILLAPDDVITVEVTPIPAQDDTDTDCEADFVVVAVATTP